MGLTETSLESAMKMTHVSRVPVPMVDGYSIGLGWQIQDTGNREIVWKGGGRLDINVYLGFVGDEPTGAVVLTNQTRFGGLHLLYQLLDPRTSLDVDARALASYTGLYEFPSGQEPPIRVDLLGGRLMLERMGMHPIPMYAESDTDFVVCPQCPGLSWELGIHFSFERDERGQVTALINRKSNRRWTKVGVLNPDAPEIETPRLSADGRHLVFRAAGQLWLQPLDDGPATRLSEAGERGWNASFSPDGRYLAFARTALAETELCVYDIEADAEPTACSAGLTWDLSEPVFSPDGQSVAFVTAGEWEVWVLELASGRTRVVARTRGSGFDDWLNWSADGRRLILQDHGGSQPNTHRIVAVDVMESTMTTIIADGLGPTPQGVIDVDGPLRADGQLLYTVAPDGKWLALTRQDRVGIWLAPLDRGHLEASDIRLVSQEGEPDFSFTPDGAALIYVAGSRIWRQPLDGGEREEISIRVDR